MKATPKYAVSHAACAANTVVDVDAGVAEGGVEIVVLLPVPPTEEPVHAVSEVIATNMATASRGLITEAMIWARSD